MSEPSSATRVSALVADPSEERILAGAAPSGLELPWAEAEGRAWSADVAAYEPLLARRIGAPVRIRRCLHRAFDEASGVDRLVFLVELEGAPDPSWAWRPIEALAAPSADVDAADRAAALAAWRAPAPPERPPWLRGDGWDAEADAWAADRLAASGEPAVGPPVTLKRWALSCVKRVPVGAGQAYFKAFNHLPLFADEVMVTRALARAWPRHMPRAIADDPARGWLLLHDLGPSLRDAGDLDGAVEAAALTARLQRESSASAPFWLAAGALDRRPHRLAADVAALVEAPEAVGAWTPDERAAVRRAVPRLEAACLEAAERMPSTLVHGDLHEGNIARCDGDLVVFDWTDACVAHPLVDTMLARWAPNPTAAAARREAYLSVWREALDDAVLARAWDLGGVVYGLHHARSYVSLIGAIEPADRPELAGAAPRFLRMALAALGDAADG